MEAALYLFDRRQAGEGEARSMYRIDCTGHVGTYPHFEARRNRRGELYFYILPNFRVKTVRAVSGKRLPPSHILSDTKNPITGLFGGEGLRFYGDVIGTDDALLLSVAAGGFTDGKLTDGARVEIVVIRWQKQKEKLLFERWQRGEFDADFERLRKQAAVTENND